MTRTPRSTRHRVGPLAGRPDRTPELDVDALLDDAGTNIIVCCGSGGVGKTTTSAALAVVILPVPWSLAGLFPGGQAVVLALLVVLFQFTTELFMTRHYGLAMVSFTPVILLMTQLAHPIDPAVLILERGAETLAGALVGIAVVVAVRPAATRTPAALLGRAGALRLPRRPRH